MFSGNLDLVAFLDTAADVGLGRRTGGGKTCVPRKYLCSAHCTKNRIYVFPKKELRGLSANSYIHVSVRDLYIPRIGPRIWLQQPRQTDPGKI